MHMRVEARRIGNLVRIELTNRGLLVYLVNIMTRCSELDVSKRDLSSHHFNIPYDYESVSSQYILFSTRENLQNLSTAVYME